MVEYVIAHCTITPVRKEPSEGSEQLTQLLFGEVCEVLDRLPRWTKIRSTLDGQEGWVDFKMLTSAHIPYPISHIQAVVATPIAIATAMETGEELILTLGTRLPNYAHGTFEVLGKQYLIDPACVSQPISNSPSERLISETPSNNHNVCAIAQTLWLLDGVSLIRRSEGLLEIGWDTQAGSMRYCLPRTSKVPWA